MSRILSCAFIASVVVAKRDDPIIGGQGQYRFQYDPTKLVMPAGALVQDCHGFSVDKDNNIILTYVPLKGDTNCIVRWGPDGMDGKFVGPGGKMCAGTPHGLRLSEEGGTQYLYHANNNQQLWKTTMEGEVVWGYTGVPNDDATFLPYAPTWFSTPPNAPYVFMSDGYGSSRIHVFSLDGLYLNISHGGKGSGDGQFQTSHSINYDPRNNQIVVTDRENHRHQWFKFDPNDPTVWEYSEQVAIPELQRPCNIRFDYGNGFSVVPALEGPVGILDPANKLVSIVNVTDLLGDKGHLHPHDATFLPNGDMVVATWNPGRLSYWRKLPAEAEK